MDDQQPNDPREIISETYEDLKMSELVDWDEYEIQLEKDMLRHEDNYMRDPREAFVDDEDECCDEHDDTEYYPEDDEDFENNGWEDEDE